MSARELSEINSLSSIVRVLMSRVVRGSPSSSLGTSVDGASSMELLSIASKE